jgi:protocatechuate 3,4-dioxygenase beta subunit
VLPGVTVEASSPVLIEKVRTATTDSSGNYRIESLQPAPTRSRSHCPASRR